MFIIINYDNIKRRGVFMNLKDLKIFVTVAEEKNISKTAEKLNYVQSNISSRIQNLEKKFATKLFYRNKDGMILTSNDEVLKDYANKILSVSEEMEDRKSTRLNQCVKLEIASV